jgi:biuret amidohydrolase
MTEPGSSLQFTLDHIDDVMDRSAFVAPDIDPSRAALLALDIQKLCVDPAGAAYIESVGGAPSGVDVLEPCLRVLSHCRSLHIPVFWSKWGLRGDGLDAGICTLKWPGMNPGAPDSPATWGHRDSEIADEVQPLPGEPIIEKHRFSTFYDTPFDEYLRGLGVEYLIIIGVTSANCAHATAIDGWNKNYKVIVVADCTTALPHSKPDQPLGTGQHWEALRNIQMNYGDVVLSSELIEKLGTRSGAQASAVPA